MNVDVFVTPDDPAGRAISRVLEPYGDLFRVRWHGSGSEGWHRQLLLASFQLDASSGHTVQGEAPSRAGAGYGYGYYGAYSTGSGAVVLPAIAVFDRLALIASTGGPPQQIRPGVWLAPFKVEDLLRAAFHQALEAAFAEVRESYANLRASRGGVLLNDAAAAMLHVTPAALERALRRSKGVR
ncbi:MAG: hypothetical protein ACO1SX_03990 [Actinomycetota bacterium]